MQKHIIKQVPGYHGNQNGLALMAFKKKTKTKKKTSKLKSLLFFTIETTALWLPLRPEGMMENYK